MSICLLVDIPICEPQTTMLYKQDLEHVSRDGTGTTTVRLFSYQNDISKYQSFFLPSFILLFSPHFFPSFLLFISPLFFPYFIIFILVKAKAFIKMCKDERK